MKVAQVSDLDTAERFGVTLKEASWARLLKEIVTLAPHQYTTLIDMIAFQAKTSIVM